MDAITLLKEDHRTVEKLFKRFEKAGDKAYATKRAIVDRIIEELSVHAAVEEQLFYPVTRASVPGVEDQALESLEEHHIVKWVLHELESMVPEDERFTAKVTVLMENVRHHVEEEETEYFPEVRQQLGRTALNELGDAMAAAKKMAPTHPHANAPDEPPGNIVAGVASGIADRVGDAVSGVAQGSVSAAGDLLSTVLRRSKPSARPTGNRIARKTADSVRANLDGAADAVVGTVQRGVRAGEDRVETTARTATRAASAARSGATGTARSASRSTGRAASKATPRSSSAAKRAATAAGRSVAATTKSRSATKAGSATHAGNGSKAGTGTKAGNRTKAGTGTKAGNGSTGTRGGARRSSPKAGTR